jgi:LacI family transcriptional regulator
MNDIRRVTLADIAKKANVHVTTVSLALRDHPRLPEETRNRIKALATQMGYAPDPLLSALSTYRTRSRSPRYQSTLAYLTNWESEWGWKRTTAHPEFFAGAAKEATKLGFKLEPFWLHTPNLSEDRLGKVLVSRGIRGLILASHGREMGDIVNLDWPHFSCVKIDYFPHHPAVHNVTNHQIDIIRLAMRKVREIGYRRIGFVMHRGWDHAVDHNWMAGYLGGEQEIPEEDRLPAYIYPALHPEHLWLKENNAGIVPDPHDFQKWYRRHKPDVILSNHNFVAPVFKTLRLKIPRDVAFADLFLAEFSGGTAGVRQNHEAVGALAVQLIASELSGNRRGISEFATTTFIEGTWFPGATCPPRREGRRRSKV